MATFLEQARAGEVSPDDIDDYVERWHNGEGVEELHTFLGFTTEEYGRWLRNPSALTEIVGRRARQAAE